MSNDKQPRSPAIAIVRTNNRTVPQVEPFFRPKHLPASTQQQQQQQQQQQKKKQKIKKEVLKINL